MQGKPLQKKFEYPKTYLPKYTEKDKADVEAIIDWLNSDEVIDTRTQTTLARTAGCNQSTVQAILKGKYKSPPYEWLAQLKQAIERIDQRERGDIDEPLYIDTSVSQLVAAACKRAHLYRIFAVVAANVGTGKTTALRKYVQDHPTSTIFIEADPDMIASVLLDELVALTDAHVAKSTNYSRGTKADRMRGVIRALKGSDKLLIFDEAETVNPSCLEYIRRISDKAQIGVVLAGTERLRPMVRDPRGRFGQISSRVGFWPKVKKTITPEDCQALVQAALRHDNVTLTPEIHDAFWQVCVGSARVLMRALIPGIRDYGLNKGKPLSPELIFYVGNDLLGYKPAK